MSHITEIKVKIKDLSALKDAAEQLGGVFLEDQKTHRWYDTFVNDSETGRQFAEERGVASMGKCEHAIALKDAHGAGYEVGVIKALDGDGYSLVYDSYGPGHDLERAFGRGMVKLNQEYAAAVTLSRARKQLARNGFTNISRENLSGGRILLKIRKR